MNYTMKHFGFKAVKTKEDLDTLNNDDLVAGYLEGYKNEKPKNNKTRSYYHGFLNGLSDGKHAARNLDQIHLAEVLSKDGTLAGINELIDVFINEINGTPYNIH